MNTIPIKIKFEESNSISSVFSQVHMDSMESEPYHYYSLSKIQSLSPLKNKLIDHVLVFENYPVDKRLNAAPKEEKDKADFEVVDIDYYTHGVYKFGLVIFPEVKIRLRFEYNALVFDNEYIKDVIAYFEDICKQVIENPDKLLNEIKLHSDFKSLETSIQDDNSDFVF